MRSLSMVLILLVVFTLGLLGIIHSRKNMEIQLSKSSYLESVKLRVTTDVLKEFTTNINEANSRLTHTKKQVEDLTAEVKVAQEAADAKTAELDTCNSELNQIQADIGALDTEKNKSNTEFQQKMASLKEQVVNLKKEAEQRSKVCDYIIKSSTEGMKLCGIVVVQPADQNAPKAA